jgi:RNA polymerase sigma factor (sigma-70 family)
MFCKELAIVGLADRMQSEAASVSSDNDQRKVYILDYTSIDWEDTYKRLRVYAEELARSAPDVFDGISAEELVSEALVAFLQSPTALGWNPDRQLAAFLSGVVRHKFLDHLKRQRFVSASIDDGPLRDGPPEESSILEELSTRERIAEWMRRLSEYKDLQEVVAAAAEVADGGNNSNQQIAKRIGTTTGDVVNRKKRILRIFGRTR